ncbi:MAG: glycosyltransferase family 4 protein [Thermoanaerobaculia bacterium]
MRIVYVLESLEMSGGVKVIVEHAEGLASRGHDVVVVTRDARHDWIDVHVPVIEVPAFDAATLPEADVHVATWFPTVVPTVRARRAPKIVHFSQGYEALYANCFHRQDEIEEAYQAPVPKLLISSHLKDLFEGRFPGPFYVLPQTLRAEKFRPLELRTAPRVPPVVGIVGPFELPIKGVPSSLRAVARLREAGREVILHRASLMPMLDAEKAMGRCDLYAHAISVDEMAKWYRRLDLLLFSSTDAEGFGLPPLEAMASGVPAVISDIPSLAVLPSDAVSRVPVGDSAATAREAARLLDDPALWAARRARGLEIAGTFTIGRVLDELERIFVEVLPSEVPGEA